MHGTKDYGNVSPKETTYQLNDMAELAVRLGALPSLDRLGDVIFLEDFSNGIYNWGQVSGGDLAAISLDTTHFKSGGFSAKLMGGSDGARYAIVYMSFSYPVLSNFGLESCITIGTDVEMISFIFSIVSAGRLYKSSIYVYPGTNKISYLDSGYNIVDLVSGISLISYDYIYNNFKLVLDLIKKEYKRICYNSGVKDMTGLVLFNEDTEEPESIYIEVEVLSKTGLNGVSYLDNVIVTQNEP